MKTDWLGRPITRKRTTRVVLPPIKKTSTRSRKTKSITSKKSTKK